MDVLEGSRLGRSIRLVDHSFARLCLIGCQVVDLLDLHLVQVLLQFGVVKHAHVVWAVRIVREGYPSVLGQDVLLGKGRALC